MNAIHEVYSDSKGKNIGIDAGKSQLDIFIHEVQQHWSTGNNASDIKALVTKLS